MSNDRVLPGISPDPGQRKRDLAAADERELRRDAIGWEIAQLSEKLAEARLLGDVGLVKKLRAEQRRLRDQRWAVE